MLSHVGDPGGEGVCVGGWGGEKGRGLVLGLLYVSTESRPRSLTYRSILVPCKVVVVHSRMRNNP